MRGRGSRPARDSSRRARSLPFLAVLVALPVAVPLAVFGPAAGPATAAPGLAGRLIAAADMPAGWSKEAVPHARSIPFVPTCPGVPTTADARTAQAVEAFRTASGVPAVVELLATYPAAQPAFALIQRYVARCIAVAGSRHRAKYQFSMSRGSFPKTGDQSVAFSTSFTGAPEVAVDSVVVRQGDVLMEITLSSKGATNRALLGQMVTLGIGSLITAAPG